MIRLASAAFIIYLVTIHKGQPQSIPNANEPAHSSTQTTTPSTKTTTTPKLCLYGGDYYSPNTKLDSGRVDNWCFGIFIDEDCNVLEWDDFNCFPTTTTATTTPATSPPVSLCPHNGQELNPGDIIPTDDQWCSGVTCTIDGLKAWHYYNCTTDASTENTSGDCQ